MAKVWGARQYWDFLLFKSFADLKSEVERTYVGYLWWIVEPVLYMAIFYLVFSVLLNRGTADYVAFLLIGLTLWRWFQTTVMKGGNTISASRGIINQVYLPKIILPVVAISVNTIKFFMVFSLLLVFLWVTGYLPSDAYLSLPLLLLLQLFFIIGSTFIIAAVTPFLPDVRIVLDNLLRGLFFMSGIFFDIRTVSEPYQSYLMLNPMANLIDQYRRVLINQLWPDWNGMLIVFLISGLFVFIGVFLLIRYDRVYPRVV